MVKCPIQANVLFSIKITYLKCAYAITLMKHLICTSIAQAITGYVFKVYTHNISLPLAFDNNSQ